VPTLLAEAARDRRADPPRPASDEDRGPSSSRFLKVQKKRKTLGHSDEMYFIATTTKKD